MNPENLSRLCDELSGALCRQPWLLQTENGPLTIASNGTAALILFDGNYDCQEYDGGVPKNLIAFAKRAKSLVGSPVSLIELQTWAGDPGFGSCLKCSDTRKIVCPKCNGETLKPCPTCGQERYCDDCDGEGSKWCDDVRHDAQFKKLGLIYHGERRVYIDMRNLARFITGVDGDEVSILITEKAVLNKEPIFLRGSNWAVIIMPMDVHTIRETDLPKFVVEDKTCKTKRKIKRIV